MRVHWTDNAIEHLVGIYGYISQNSLVYKIGSETTYWIPRHNTNFQNIKI